ncbi:MAG: type 1 fimbrial protein [Acidobacteria bacterium]|nr:MAG: type 1 fimbrial protein [Acidobacteriota bacterium]
MMNKRLSVIVAVMFLAMGAFVMAHGDEAHGGDQVTIKGEIVDMACYVAHEAKGADHQACAKRCVKGGQPMGLLTADGDLYLLYASHADGSAFEAAKELAGEMVALTGKESEQNGIKGIEVASVEKSDG